MLEAYEKDGWDLVKRAVNGKGFVEEVGGLAEVQGLVSKLKKRWRLGVMKKRMKVMES